MSAVMTDEPPRPRRRFLRRRDHLLAEIEALALELDEAGAATTGGHVPLSARADYLHARRDHHRAAIMWMSALDTEQLALVSDALRECRTALESSRAALRG
jgi:hypothetical protein